MPHLYGFLEKTWCIAPHVPNAQPDVGNQVSFAPGEVKYNCDFGYEFEQTKSKAECRDGTWIALPVCKCKCPYCKHAQQVIFLIFYVIIK